MSPLVARQNENLPTVVARQAARAPNAPAVVTDSEALSYRVLDARANQMAHHLRSLGIGPNLVVGLCLPRSLDMVVGALAILKAGGAYLPLDPTFPAARLAFMMRDTQASVLVTNRRSSEGLPAGDWKVVDLTSEWPRIANNPYHPPASTVTAEDLAYVIYTSGSTGEPRGVEITHRSLSNLVKWHQRAFSVTAADRASHQAGLAFDAAIWELWPYLSVGASVHLVNEAIRSAPALIRDWLLAQHITISFLPTALAEQVMALDWQSNSTLRILLTGADALRKYPRAGLPFTVVNNYGPTECAVVATSGIVPPRNNPSQPPSIGRPIDNTQIFILDEHLRQVPDGEIGELHIGGAGVARGYVNRPELTKKSFIGSPFSDSSGARLYKTGDLARQLPDGEIAFVGRKDDQIKSLGDRIERGEIVTVLNRHPAVQASVVVTREDTSSDKRLLAYVVPLPGARLSDGTLE